MAQPTDYIRLSDLTLYQTENPNIPIPGSDLDNEYNAIKTTIDQVLANLALIQRDDTELSNNSVGIDQLKQEVFIAINQVTDWATTTDYVKGNAVWVGSALYFCVTDHTSAVFNDDLVLTYWTLVIDFAAYDGAASASANASEVSNLASQSAQALAEAARDAAIVAQGLSEDAQTGSEAALADFNSRFLGVFAADPVTTLNGALYWNSNIDRMKLYSVSDAAWHEISGVSNAQFFTYTATAAQTTFNGLDDNANFLNYQAGYTIISLNGIWLNDEDFSAANGSDVVLTVGATAGDTLRILSMGTFDIANNYNKETLDIMFGDVSSVTPGSIITRVTNAIPTGYLECNGASLATATYPELYSEIGNTFGGDATNFNIPDFRGEFLRGWDHGRTADPDRNSRTSRGDGVTGDNVGTKQGSQFGSHNHGGGNHSHSAPAFFSNNIGLIQSNSWSGLTTQSSTGNSGTIISTQGGNETRGRNVNVLYCIKY